MRRDGLSARMERENGMSLSRVLVSVADKTGIVAFCQAISAQVEEFIASRGSAGILEAAGLPVTPIEALGTLPEMLEGRVKTLQPQIHGGILALRTPEHLAELRTHNIRPIDLVVVNLYPFEETAARPDTSWDEAMAQIDIGGVALIRAAAKNHAHVAAVVDPGDYGKVAEAWVQGTLDADMRRVLALKAFRRTMAYDAAIAGYLETRSAESPGLPPALALNLVRLEESRYGENPHQQGGYYGTLDQGLPFQQLHGKPMSFNNWLDLDGSWRASQAFSEPTVAITKHGNPCGIASAPTLAEAYAAALASDPVSAFGSVVSCNRTLDAATAGQLAQLFVEVIAAPDFEAQALGPIQKKRNIRILRARCPVDTPYRACSVLGGMLVQERDASRADLDPDTWTCVTRQQPTAAQLEALRFAWHAVRFVKSNAIVFVQGTAAVGIGAGQMSRLDAVHMAAHKAGARAQGAVMASDAFFPFPDGIEEAARAGIRAVVQPGGSMRDRAVIRAADELGLVMMHTGYRHFLH